MHREARPLRLQKIISGGQTGADRAALDFAIAHSIPHGGWCPCGRWAEDGPIPARYQLTETPSADPAQRTEWNVRDADGTVIFSMAPALTGGSKKTAEFAKRYGKPCLHLARAPNLDAAAAKLSDFLRRNRITILNVAGPRRSGETQIGKFVRAILKRVITSSPYRQIKSELK